MDKILLVEDDFSLSKITKRIIEKNGYEVTQAYSVEEATACMKEKRFDLILLDLMLPDGAGTDLCRKIREHSFCPIIFVSCISDSETKIDALQLGGDDYITKPVNYDELIARIQINIRRAKMYNLGRSDAEIEQFPGLYVNKKSRAVWLTDEAEKPVTKVDLSPTEYKILCVFMEKHGELILYHELFRELWSEEDLGDVRTVMVHVSNLKKKLGSVGEKMFRTVRGAGYIFGN